LRVEGKDELGDERGERERRERRKRSGTRE
jgi:hypothetical protein